jgi:hypothetical protein
MIVVIGLPAFMAETNGEGIASGLAVDVARAVVSRRREAQLVGKIGDDGAGDAVVVSLGRMGIGHSALLRDPALATPVLARVEAPAPAYLDPSGLTSGEPSEGNGDSTETDRVLPEDPSARPGLDPADISLALSYVAGAKVVVVAEALDAPTLKSVADGAAFSKSAVVAIVFAGDDAASLPPDATILEAPAVDDGSFARLVGIYAAELDAGNEPAAAFETAIAASGWEIAEA